MLYSTVCSYQHYHLNIHTYCMYSMFVQYLHYVQYLQYVQYTVCTVFTVCTVCVEVLLNSHNSQYEYVLWCWTVHYSMLYSNVKYSTLIEQYFRQIKLHTYMYKEDKIYSWTYINVLQSTTIYKFDYGELFWNKLLFTQYYFNQFLLNIIFTTGQNQKG